MFVRFSSERAKPEPGLPSRLFALSLIKPYPALASVSESCVSRSLPVSVLSRHSLDALAAADATSTQLESTGKAAACSGINPNLVEKKIQFERQLGKTSAETLVQTLPREGANKLSLCFPFLCTLRQAPSHEGSLRANSTRAVSRQQIGTRHCGSGSTRSAQNKRWQPCVVPLAKTHKRSRVLKCRGKKWCARSDCTHNAGRAPSWRRQTAKDAECIPWKKVRAEG